MKKLYNGSSPRVLAVSVLILGALFFFVHPRASSFFPSKAQQQLSSFIKTSTQNKSVDAQNYWQFREFYSLGSFTFDSNVVTVGESLRLTALPNQQSLLLQFNSPKLISRDYIVKRDNQLSESEQAASLINEVANQYPAPAKVLFKDESTLLQQYEDQSYVLVFIKTIDEMKKANGFFNYSANEQQLLENTFWLNVTHIN